MSKKLYKLTPEHEAMPPGPDRWRERSRFFPGIAQAMASQWGPLLTEIQEAA